MQGNNQRRSDIPPDDPSPKRRLINDVNLSEDSCTDMDPTADDESPLSPILLTPTVQPQYVTPQSTAQRSLSLELQDGGANTLYDDIDCEMVPGTQMNTFESRLQIAHLLNSFATTARLREKVVDTVVEAPNVSGGLWADSAADNELNNMEVIVPDANDGDEEVKWSSCSAGSSSNNEDDRQYGGGDRWSCSAGPSIPSGLEAEYGSETDEEEQNTKKRRRLKKSQNHKKRKHKKTKTKKRTRRRRRHSVSFDSDSLDQRVSPIVSNGEDSARSSSSPRPSPPSPSPSPPSPSTPRPPSPLPPSQGRHLSAPRIPVVLRIQTSKGKSLHFSTHIFFRIKRVYQSPWNDITDIV